MTVNMQMPKIPTVKQMPRRAAPLGVALLVLFCAAAGFVGGWAGAKAQRENGLTSSSSQQIVSSESELISSIAKDVGPSVVSVNVTSQASSRNPFGFGGFGGPQQSSGTGFIVSDDGIVATNRHVISAAGGTTAISITLSDGTELADVEVIGQTNESDPLDIAFLRIKDKKGKDLKPAKIGDSSKMEVGDKVVAIGNALGQFQNTVTTGIISGYGRSLVAGDASGSQSESLQNLFQTDAAINQGNSGGPLVNTSGEVIGINTAVAGEGAENIGFAIPINDVQNLIKSVLEKGKLERPYLGVRYVPLTDDVAYELNLGETKRGAYIAPQAGGQSSILPDSPAAEAGLKEKDIIVKVNNEPIDDKNSLTSLVGRYKVGEQITLTIVRDGKQQDIKVTLKAAPQN